MNDPRRVAACLKALEGVPTEWLETYVSGGAKNVIQENAALKDDADKAWKAAMTLGDGVRTLQAENTALSAEVERWRKGAKEILPLLKKVIFARSLAEIDQTALMEATMKLSAELEKGK
jgi:hypothetical protein